MSIEYPNCEYFVPMQRGLLNFCKGNEPYRCSRTISEGLCHKSKDDRDKLAHRGFKENKDVIWRR